MAYKVEHDEVYNDLRCVVIFTDMGHRCGYVGVNEDHVLYLYGYNEDVPPILLKKWEDIKNGPIGKRGILDVLMASIEPNHVRVGYLFDVHEGITYTGGKGKYPVEAEGVWWFGFDCAHSEDARDIDSANKYGYTLHPLCYDRIPGTEVRTLEYCIKECHSLADQLNEIQKEVMCV